MTAEDLAARLHGKRTAGGWIARCPAHDDKNPSLSIGAADDGRVLLKCFAGCDFAAIVGALGLTAADLAPPDDDRPLSWGSPIGQDDDAPDVALTWETPVGPTGPTERRLVKAYPYTDADGRLLFEVCRYAPKTFRQRRPDGAGGWRYDLRGVERVLYRLPDVLRAVAAGETVHVVEGEKDADALAALGLAVTTASGGAGKWQPGYTAALAGADVIILPDRDEPGRRHGALVAAALRGRAKSVRVVELPDRDEHRVKDAADWIGAGGTADELAALVEAATPAPEPATPADGAMDGAEMLATDPPPHNPVLAGLFDWRALVEIVGPSKSRKSFLAMHLALSLAAGRDFFGFAVPSPFSVLLADLELSPADLRRRLWRMGRALGIGPADVGDRLRVLPLAGQEAPQGTIEAAAVGADVVIADPLFCLCEGGETIEDLRGPLRWLRRLAVGRAACCFVHHDSKGSPGDRDTRDRGSGSGITGRSVDARLTVTPAAADADNAVVMAAMCRSYVTPPPRTLSFNGDCFEASDLPTEPERSADRRAKASRPKIANFAAAGEKILRERGPLAPSVFKSLLRDLGLSKNDCDVLTATLAAPDGPAVRWSSRAFPPQHFIGTREQQQSSQSSREDRREDRRDSLG